MKGWDSTRVIGDVKEMYRHYTNRPLWYDVDIRWHAYYNGWLEGRLEMLREMEE